MLTETQFNTFGVPSDDLEIEHQDGRDVMAITHGKAPQGDSAITGNPCNANPISK